ncbi:winged helix-turn-helix transcriptional regulator [Vallitalea pronyensis]|uniref:Winged helix-turn-helix transcriptional regulator n=1 Tax=Vallitalea pronyensis TaxID=1348613 RepID=A0A8J8MKW4_9FIRM|nr:metalloregulator ArsR/SmtB family transcription factor [Vallitalea pronyensis]QUI23409.1 winged helix-turn-helix transcriptional regulator [Vallitalea pronyensis]
MEKLIVRFKALSDETRFKLFLLLAEKQLCVGGLAKVLGISESAVSQHLKVLRNADLIKGEKVGYYVHYKVQKDILEELKGVIEQLANGVELTEQKKSLGIYEAECESQCNKNGKGCDA